jgi:hypothetical protein
MVVMSETWSRYGTCHRGFLKYSINGVRGKGCETRAVGRAKEQDVRNEGIKNPVILPILLSTAHRAGIKDSPGWLRLAGGVLVVA